MNSLWIVIERMEHGSMWVNLVAAESENVEAAIEEASITDNSTVVAVAEFPEVEGNRGVTADVINAFAYTNAYTQLTEVRESPRFVMGGTWNTES